MSNTILQAALQAMCDAIVDSIKAVKSNSGVSAQAMAAGAAVLSDADLKAQVGTLMVAGISGVGAALKDLANLEDDLQLAIDAVPMIEKVIAAIKS